MQQNVMARLGLICSALALAAAQPALADPVTLDFDSVATGSALLSTPLVTSLGTITASSTNSNLDLVADPTTGLSGKFLYHGQLFDSGYAHLAFDFDVSEIAFKWTGYGAGVLSALALNASFNFADSFFDNDTGADGPGRARRSCPAPASVICRFGDFPGGSGQSGIDDVVIHSVPEPATLALAGLSLLGLAASRRRLG